MLTGFLSRPAAALSIPVPEHLTFELAWEGIYAGTSTLSISRDAGDGYKIVSTAASADYISVFYKVRDMIESVTRPNSFASMSYRVTSHEGKHVKDLGLLFAGNDGRKMTAFIDYMGGSDKREKDFKTPTGVMDPLSSFFFVRTLPLVVGKPVYVTIFDDEKVWNVEVQVLRKERVQTWAGTFNTILIRPVMKSSGIFRRNGDIYIWLTDDARRMPVMLESKVKIGSIKAILQKVSY
ncbi:MAG: DUF3108 domain-containing protein [Nitrospiraceae bacterium]|nr:DUF3108 domain-containing protein [Nitrospiraceae bacterium]